MEPESPGQLQAAQVSRLEGAKQKDSSGALAEGRVPETLGARGWGHLLLTPPGLLGRCSTVLVHLREHLRHWFHWSSGLLHCVSLFHVEN